ncbi:unnamed protein product [Moneuplotes crassus]|uniref:Band 7 domain-containing protein n=2 Tax=Euplotes crassus TaxID=5936 RepID=A0AAD1XLC0_EUPCR|nr:unnamed protein product [Moneuplotes crassus]
MMLPWVLVPQQNKFVLERFGRFAKVLEPGINLKIPIIDMVAYRHNFKEQVINVDSQNAITKDNVKLKIDGVLYYKFTDAKKASYNVKNPIIALSLLAQTSMRSEIGVIELDRTFEERENLNTRIKETLSHASEMWGIECMRYEIKDIQPPEEISRSMELQAESERMKRSAILNSEGERQAIMNIAEGEKSAAILKAEGDARKTFQEARAIIAALETISKSVKNDDGMVSLKLKLTEKYLEAMNKIMTDSKVVVLPPSADTSSLTTQIVTGLELYKDIINNNDTGAASALMGADSQYNEIKQKLDQLNVNNKTSRTVPVKTSPQYEFLDDKILY